MLTFRNYVCVRLCLLGLALVYTAVDAKLYEGDPCQMKDSSPGICRLQSNCTEINEALDRGTMSVYDPVRCNYIGDEEVICCPKKRESNNPYWNAGSTNTSISVSTPTTQPISFETRAIKNSGNSENSGYWIHLYIYNRQLQAEGDPCKMKDSSPGICRLQSNCKEIMDAIKFGTMSVNEPVRCSYMRNDVVICCPNKSYPSNLNWPNQYQYPSVMNQNIWQQLHRLDFLKNNRANPNIRSNQPNTLYNNFDNIPDCEPYELQIENLETAASGNSLNQINSGMVLLEGERWINQKPRQKRQLNVDPMGKIFNNLVDSSMDIVKLEDIFDTTVGVWNVEEQSSSQSSIVPPNIVPPRIGQRAAIIACSEIEKGLSASLGGKILNGNETSLGEFPHMAAIGFLPSNDDKSENYNFRCGGTLIDKKFVLSAAHCFRFRDGDVAKVVRLGFVDFTNKEQLNDAVTVQIKKIYLHPNYRSLKIYDDIALVELEHEINVTADNIAPTCLYTDAVDPPKEFGLYATGWGLTELKTRSTSKILLKAKLEISPLQTCNASYISDEVKSGLTESHLCAFDQGKTSDTCQGDSGGPLNMVIDQDKRQYRVVGITSAGHGCGSDVPSLYTRVSAYLDFIESIVWPDL